MVTIAVCVFPKCGTLPVLIFLFVLLCWFWTTEVKVAINNFIFASIAAV